MSLAAGTLLGPYEILSVLGAGGMGEVYQARDTRLGRIVAIKTIVPQFAANGERRSRFEREALSVSALSHPHICAFYDIGQDGPIDFLVMEYLEGETLDWRLMRGPLPLDEALVLGKQIADALDQVHRRGFTHRDLKPSNIMLTRSGAKLLDFGLAKLESHFSSLSEGGLLKDTKTLSAEGTIVGTVQYMAPEQLEGGHVDHRADLFAFGAVLYEMVTGRRPFKGDSIASQIAAILSTEPSPPSSSQPLVPLSLDRLIRRCLSKDPDDRWQTARDLCAELIWIADGESEKDGALAAIAHRRRRRSGWIATAIAGLVVVPLTVAWLVNRPRTVGTSGDVVRFWISAPQETTFDAGGGFMAVSPNGRFLSFVASKMGKRSLWLRPVDSPFARALDGTEGATQPFWSPDDQFLAFGISGKLKKINVSTGLVETICDTPRPIVGGAWSIEGMVLFSMPFEGIFGVPAAGGIPAPVTKLDGSQGELGHGWPVFLPDGRHFLYLVNSTRSDRAGVYVGSLDSQDRSRILSVLSSVQYAPEGYLVYQRRATLVAQPFDAKTFRLTGEPLPLAEQVAQNQSTKRSVASISSNGLLAYRTVGESELAWFDRQGVRLGSVGLPGQYGSPALSPDEREVAVSVLNPKVGTEDIWTIETASGRARRLTFDDASDTEPAWSPDGARVLFASNRRGKFDLFWTLSDGSGDQLSQALPGARQLYPRDWTIDGQLAYEASTPCLVFFPMSGLQTAGVGCSLIVGSVSHARISPDRRWIAYASHESGFDEVYVRAFPLTAHGKWQISVRGGIAPVWRMDGTELFYLGSDQTIMAVSIKEGRSFEASRPQALFRIQPTGVPGRPLDGFAVSRNGLRFLVNQPTRDIATPITVVVNWTKSLPH